MSSSQAVADVGFQLSVAFLLLFPSSSKDNKVAASYFTELSVIANFFVSTF